MWEPVGRVGGARDLEIFTRAFFIALRALDPACKSMRDQCPAAEPLLLASFRVTAEVNQCRSKPPPLFSRAKDAPFRRVL